jgi:hypothetical protein
MIQFYFQDMPLGRHLPVLEETARGMLAHLPYDVTFGTKYKQDLLM